MEILTAQFESIYTIMEQQFGPMGPVYGGAGAGLLLLLIAVTLIMPKRAKPVGDLRGRQSIVEDSAVSLRGADANDGGALDRYAAFLEPTSKEDLTQARQKMMRAGFRGPKAVRYFYFARAGMAIGAIVLMLLALTFAVAEIDVMNVTMATTMAGLVGYLFPVWWINKRTKKRTEEITNGFPDALDLMLVCVEAGHSLDQALVRVAQESEAANPTLAEEFRIVGNEMRAGKERNDVLRDFADRCGVTDVSSFVTVLVQSAAFGTSIAQALRVYAAEMRDKRLMRAEEKANLLPVKLTLGTMGFTVPPLLLILIGPSLIEILRALTGLGGQ
jgi:tight adherence protein C